MRESLELYLADCTVRGLSPATIETYRIYITPLLDLPEIPTDQPGLFLHLMRYRNDRSRHSAFRAIKSYVRWGARHGRWADWITGIQLRCRPADPTPPLSLEEFQRIMEVIPTTPRGLRDRAIYSLLMFTGCRRDAIRCLRHENLMLADRLIQVREKGGKHPFKPLVPAAVRALVAWLEHAPPSPFVFPSFWHPTKPVDSGMVTKYLQRYAKAAGIERRVYTHLLRHSAANLLLEADVPIDAVQAILGHAHIRTTQIYARTSPGRIRAGLEAAFGSV